MHLAFLHIADSTIITYSKIMKRILYLFYILIQCTWGFGQTIIGFFFFIIHIRRPHKFYRGAIQTQWNDRWAGLSLGLFIFVPNNEGDYFTGARVHEYGHTIQSLVLGPLYAFVGVVSVGWGSVIYPILKSKKNIRICLTLNASLNTTPAGLVKKLPAKKLCGNSNKIYFKSLRLSL